LVNQDQKDAVLVDLNKEWDRRENESMPDAAVSTNTVDFGDVRFATPVTRYVELKNTGPGRCNVRFIPKLDEKNYCKPWLVCYPHATILDIGAKIKITLTVHIEADLAPLFNTGKEELKDILVLHIEHGKDIFVYPLVLFFLSIHSFS